MRWSTCRALAVVIGCLGLAVNAEAQTTTGGSTLPATSTSATGLGSTAGIAPPGTYPPPGSGAHTLHFLSQSTSNSVNCFCNSCVGQFLKMALRPLKALLGGGIAGQPAAAAAAGAAAASGGAGGTAAAIQADQAGANARRDAVRYLGTVDCHYYPEAEAALVNALRTDRSECVRLEAALALSHGCCCTKSTIEALRITVSGSEKDGNPGETSPRVRIAAFNSLQGCCQRNANNPQPEILPRPEPAVAKQKEGEEEDEETIVLSAYYQDVERRPLRELLHASEMTLNQVRAVSGIQTVAVDAPVRNGGSLLELWARASVNPESAESRAPTPVPQPNFVSPAPTTAVANNPAFPPPAARPEPSVIYSARRELPPGPLVPSGEVTRLPDPNSPGSYLPPSMIPDSSLPGRRANLY